MLKKVTSYKINVLASVNNGVAAQILFRNETSFFVGRIDFYFGSPAPASYLWHPNNLSDPEQTYIVLAMPFVAFDTITELLRTEKPWSLELWPLTSPPVGAITNGYAGRLFTPADEPVGEQEFDFSALHP